MFTLKVGYIWPAYSCVFLIDVLAIVMLFDTCRTFTNNAIIDIINIYDFSGFYLFIVCYLMFPLFACPLVSLNCMI